MRDCRREISKEDYDLIMTESKGNGHVPESLVTKFFSMDILMGYGLYSTRIIEKDGKYYLDYSVGDSCD